MSSPKLTAAICTYDRYDILPNAIVSLSRQSLTRDEIEIIVVDNSPDAHRSKLFSMQFKDITNLRWEIEGTPGLSNARNVAIRLANAPLVAFIDDDAVASIDWSEQLITAFETFGPQATAAGGQVVPMWEIPRPDWLPDSLLGCVSAVNWGGSARWAEKHEWVAGTNLAFRTEAIRAIGGFSTLLGRKKAGYALLSNDELEVIETLRARGGRLLYVPQAKVEHLVAADRLAQSWFRRRMTWQAISDYLQDPKAMYEAAPKYWDDVLDFYSLLAPKHRTPAGFLVNQDDPEMFRRQLSALYNFTVASLAGFHGLEVV